MLNLDHPVLVAHRGYAKGQDFDRNSFQAFKYAIEVGADALETDLRITADGEIVIHHDRFVRNGLSMKFISNSDYEELIAIKGSQTAIPRFSELLELTQDRLPLFIQIKAAQDVPTILDLIRSSGHKKIIVMGYLQEIIGKHTNLLKDLDIKTGKHYMLPLRRNLNCVLNYPESVSLEVISPYYRFLTSNHLHQIHHHGYYNIPFTINERKTMLKLGNHDFVNGFYTDHLEEAINLFY